MNKKYSLNIKTGFIFCYTQHPDGICTGYDFIYALKNRNDIKTGFKTEKQARSFYERIRPKKRRIIK